MLRNCIANIFENKISDAKNPGKTVILKSVIDEGVLVGYLNGDVRFISKEK